MTQFDTFVMMKTHEIVCNAVNHSLNALEQCILARENNDKQVAINASKIAIQSNNTVMCAAKAVTDFAFTKKYSNISELEYSNTLKNTRDMVEPYIKFTSKCVKDICEIRDDF